MVSDTLTPRQVRQRLDTLCAIAYGAEVSTKLADDQGVAPAEREHARESVEVMMRQVSLSLDELHKTLERQACARFRISEGGSDG